MSNVCIFRHSISHDKHSPLDIYKQFILRSYYKMILFIFLISQNLLYAFNENLNAVHYSIVTPGIDEELKPGV